MNVGVEGDETCSSSVSDRPAIFLCAGPRPFHAHARGIPALALPAHRPSPAAAVQPGN